MTHPRILELVREAIRAAQMPEPPLYERAGSVPVGHYTDPSRLARERQQLFRSLPLPIAHASEVRPNHVVVRSLDGISVLLTRGDDGDARGFRNACRHRGVRLVREDCRAKALVCPYHGWTYALDGTLLHIPHFNAFPSCKLAEQGLVPVRVEERHGLIWGAAFASAPNVRTHLGEIDEELAGFGFESHVVGERVVTEQRGNWKMLMEAFLEGYHLRTLHRDSIYPFFLDARGVAHRAGPHVRAATARRSAREADGATMVDTSPLGELATVSYTVFPATTLIAHPDWTSLILVQPLATDRFVWSHTQLLPRAPDSDSARAHFARSFALIEERVFQNEDLRMCAEAQAGIETGANTELSFGLLESPALWFHEQVDERVGSPSDGDETMTPTVESAAAT